MLISYDNYVRCSDLIVDPYYNPDLKIEGSNIKAVLVTGEKQIFQKNVKLLREIPGKPYLLYCRTDEQFTRQMFESIKPFYSHVYAVNCEFQHPMITQIPIGFNTIYQFEAAEVPERNILCYINFDHEQSQYVAHAPYRYAREDCYNYFKDLEFAFKEGDKISSYAYFRRLTQSHCVICPHGYGLDSYRVYEAAWCGARPVVLSSGLDPLHAKFGAIIVNDWSEVTKEFLEKKLADEPFKFNPDVFHLEHFIPPSPCTPPPSTQSLNPPAPLSDQSSQSPTPHESQTSPESAEQCGSLAESHTSDEGQSCTEPPSAPQCSQDQ
jgi:hypothetical protein